MNNIFSFINRISATLGVNASFLHILFKILLAIVGTYVLWLILKHAVSSFEKKAKASEFIQSNMEVFDIIRRALLYGLLLIAGTYLIRLFNMLLVEKLFHAVLIVVLSAPVKDLLLILVKYFENSIVKKTKTKADDIIFDLLKKFLAAIIYAIAFILALDILGINVMPFVAGAGVAGIAIGFAAKDTLSNLIAGVLLLVDRPFEIGDRIEVWSAPAGSATWGDVIDIGLRATRIKTTDNIIIVIPNNEIMKRDIVNYTIISTKIRVRVNIGIAYNADIDKAKDLLVEVAKSADWISKKPPPIVVVKSFGESCIDLQLRVWIEDARKRMQTISYVTDKVKEAFDKGGIEIPYPKRDITITNKLLAEGLDQKQ